MAFCPKCGAQIASDAAFCGACGTNIAAVESPTIQPPPQSNPVNAGIPIDHMKPFIEGLGGLKQKISKHAAYLGVAIGFAILTFSLFFPWATIPTGQMAVDGGSVTGWHEKAYLAILPLIFALYPVFLQRSVEIKNVLANIAIAFALLAYNNVVNRETWHNGFGNMGSSLGTGFWIGLLSMCAISACGLAWTLHSGETDATNPEGQVN